MPGGRATPSTNRLPSEFSFTTVPGASVVDPSGLLTALFGNLMLASGEVNRTVDPSGSFLSEVPGGRVTPSTLKLPSAFSLMAVPGARVVDPSAFVMAVLGSFVLERGLSPAVLTIDILPSGFLMTVTDDGSFAPFTE
jgi:hypothetical protein